MEVALRDLDRAAFEAARWYGDKGRSIETIELDEAFVLDAAAPHVLATATFRGAGERGEAGERERRRGARRRAIPAGTHRGAAPAGSAR